MRNSTFPQPGQGMRRRAFLQQAFSLTGASAGAALLTACGISGTTATAVPSTVPQPAAPATSAPAATAVATAGAAATEASGAAPTTEATAGATTTGAATAQATTTAGSTTGQNAMQQAKYFTEAVGVTGVLLSKLDGTAKGGVVFSVCDQLKVPVRFVGTGERPQDLARFEPRGFVEALFRGG